MERLTFHDRSKMPKSDEQLAREWTEELLNNLGSDVAIALQNHGESPIPEYIMQAIMVGPIVANIRVDFTINTQEERALLS